MTPFEASTLPTPDAIGALTDRVIEFLERHNVDARATHYTALVLNEILTNLATHGGCRNRPATISVVVEPNRVIG